MTEQPPRRRTGRTRIGGATAVAAALLALPACSGAAPHRADGAAGGNEPGSAASAPPSPSVSAAADAVRAAQEQAQRERAAAAPGGDAIAPGPKGADGGEDGVPVLTDGDLTVYRPRKGSGGLTVPVKITNNGKDRAFYTVELRITGPGGFESVVRLDTDTVGVHPHTDWPTELTATHPGKPVPEEPGVTVLRNDRQPGQR
ncbi:hypothetical protein [Streptomyces sp. NPDC007369]|uniref:hypothetical protein n=1 Tax=Streptomyces sp. NPDC007369 TaxID=3154589 RepID=UPI0033CDAB5D